MMMWDKIKQKWDKFNNPVPKGTTTFHGDMDEYRKAVNANIECSPEQWDRWIDDGFTPMKDGKINLTKEKIAEIIRDRKKFKDDNARLNNELDTARSAMAKHIGKSRAKEMVYEERIKYLENKLKGMRTNQQRKK